MQRIAVVDYGMGNLRSVRRRSRTSRRSATSSSPPMPRSIRDADARRAARARAPCPTACAALDASGPARRRARGALRDRPFLGVCLGLQMLFDASEEGPTPVPGRCCAAACVRFRDEAMVMRRRRAPQGAAHGLDRGAAGAAASAVGGHRRRQPLLFRAQLSTRCRPIAALTRGDDRLSGSRLLARLRGIISSPRSSIRKRASAPACGCSPISSPGTEP